MHHTLSYSNKMRIKCVLCVASPPVKSN